MNFLYIIRPMIAARLRASTMQDFDDFLGRDLRLFGVDEEFLRKLKWMDKFVQDEVHSYKCRM